MNNDFQLEFNILDFDYQKLQTLCGTLDQNITFIATLCQVKIAYRNDRFSIQGQKEQCHLVKRILETLYHQLIDNNIDEIDETLIISTLKKFEINTPKKAPQFVSTFSLKTKRGLITAKSKNQHHYIDNILNYDVCFGIGPAGTGKTYLAVAAAIEALETHKIKKIILTRPAIEAGEKLGFLPGDLSQKVDPYLRPIYDALYDMLGFEKVEKLMSKNIIEIAPLAYMRGRTLNDAFIILDEGQNATISQLKMFLTRIGFNSKAVITGDITQIDLPKGVKSGLKHAINALKSINTLSFNFFNTNDVIRHPIVAEIVKAYEQYEGD